VSILPPVGKALLFCHFNCIQLVQINDEFVTLYGEPGQVRECLFLLCKWCLVQLSPMLLCGFASRDDTGDESAFYVFNLLKKFENQIWVSIFG